MIDLRKVEGDREVLTKETLLANVSDYQIFSYYIGREFNVGRVINSPLREDKNPSFTVFRSREGSLLFKDHATGDCGDCISFVERLFRNDFYGTLIRINLDFNLGLAYRKTAAPKGYQRHKENFVPGREGEYRKPSKIGVKAKSGFSDHDLAYWSQYGITEELLKLYKVIPVQFLYLDGRKIATSTRYDPVFAYLFKKDDKYSFKIYRPLTKLRSDKWMSNTDRSVLQGWDQLPETGPRLIITKSLKDVMVLRTFGESALAMQTEISSVKPSVMQQLFNRFAFITLLQDFELAGVRGVNKMRKMYPELGWFFLQDFHTRGNRNKDISDTVKNLGWYNTWKFFAERLNHQLKIST